MNGLRADYREIGTHCEKSVAVQMDCMKLLLVYARHLDPVFPRSAETEVLDPNVAIPACKTALGSFTLVNDNYNYD